MVRNYQQDQPSTGDVNVTVQWTYTADNLTATMKALNAATGDQLTQFVYGTALGTSDVARNDVLSSTVYADGGTVSYLVNRQSERKQLTDQNGTVHAYAFDLLANPISDSVTTLGAGLDGAVRRIGRTYDVRGLLEHVTSFSDATGASVVNDILRVYNSFEQCVSEYQEHDGTVNTATSVVVGYEYADGSANTIRQTALIYPNGRVITQGYGTAGGIDDAVSRVASLIDDDGTHLVDYTRIGVNTFVQQNSPQPQISWSLINGTGIDPYTGFDQFNQIADNRWYSTATNVDLDRIQHGYDRAGNRLYRKNTVAEAAGVYLDELYAYDGMYRLARLDRGQLNSTNTGIVPGTEDFTQAWGLDSTGNWSTFNQADAGGGWTLEQTRSANAVNEITGIAGGGWVVPEYDAAGNTTQFPQPNAPSTANLALYDAWNRMVSIADGRSGVQQTRFDGANRRIGRVESGARRDAYYSSQWRLLEERLGGWSTPDRQFVWGVRYIDGLLLRDRTGERLYAMQDPNWNVTAVCDSTRVIQERYNYAAYGLPVFLTPSFTARQTSSVLLEVLYAGYYFDLGSSLALARRRILNAIVGAWTTVDPIQSGPNRYSYVGENPVGRIDPHGLQALQGCIEACVSACDNEFGWYNPQRYICRSYCDNACSGTPDIWDRIGNLIASVCAGVNSFANSKPVTCACGLVGLADLASSNSLVEAADCACNGLTTIQTLCNRGVSGSLLYGALTALDCSSGALAALGCEVGAFAGGITGSVPGALIGCFIGSRVTDTLVDVGAWLAQNYDQQGVPIPAAQAKACCDIAAGNW